MMALEYYLYYIYYSFLGFPFVLRVGIVAISIFLPLFLFGMTYFASTCRKYRQKKKMYSELQEKYAAQIKNVITSKESYTFLNFESMFDAKIKKLSKKKKRVLTNVILNICENEEKTNTYNSQRLIEYLTLRQYWEKKIKYGSLSSRSGALRKLDDLDIEIPGSVITYLTYNRNEYLRKKARSSYINFSKNDPLKFFDEDFDKTLNNWDKVEIHRVLAKRFEQGLPNLTQWIKNSKNVVFQCFLIDEISFFNQTDSCPFLLEMADTHNMQLRKHCIDALGNMKYAEAEKNLITSYVLQPQFIQHSIIEAIQKFDTGKALNFLNDCYMNAINNESRLIILTAIFNYGEIGKKLFYTQEKVSTGFSKQIFEHISNPLLAIS